jgi:hypothetical protein
MPPQDRQLNTFTLMRNPAGCHANESCMSCKHNFDATKIDQTFKRKPEKSCMTLNSSKLRGTEWQISSHFERYSSTLSCVGSQPWPGFATRCDFRVCAMASSYLARSVRSTSRCCAKRVSYRICSWAMCSMKSRSVEVRDIVMSEY